MTGKKCPVCISIHRLFCFRSTCFGKKHEGTCGSYRACSLCKVWQIRQQMKKCKAVTQNANISGQLALHEGFRGGCRSISFTLNHERSYGACEWPRQYLEASHMHVCRFLANLPVQIKYSKVYLLTIHPALPGVAIHDLSAVELWAFKSCHKLPSDLPGNKQREKSSQGKSTENLIRTGALQNIAPF